MKAMNITIINSIMKKYMKYFCVVLLVLCTSASAWATDVVYNTVTDKPSNTKNICGNETWMSSAGMHSANAKGVYWSVTTAATTAKVTDITNTEYTSRKVTKIVVNGRRNKEESVTINATIGGSAFGSQYVSTPSSSDYEFTATFSKATGTNGEIVLTLKSQGGGSVWIKSITVTYEGVELHYGPNGETIANIGVGEAFPSFEEIPGWYSLNYWATADDKNCEPEYPSGDTYYAGTTAASGVYYALYQGYAYGCNYGDYSCKPTPTYVLSLNNPSTGSGVNLVVPNVGCGPAGTTVTLTYTINEPGTSYQGATITRDDNSQAVSFTHDAEEQTVTFTLPTSDVTAEISFDCPDLTSKTVTINDIVPYFDGGVWKANVTWDAVSGATQYDIQVNDITGGSTFLPATAQAGTSCLLTGFTEGHTYRAIVQANNPCASGNHTPSATKDFTPECPTLEGTLVIAVDEVTSTSASISWSGVTTSAIQTTGGASTAITYDVKITQSGGADGGILNVTDVDYTEWSSTSLTTGATYTVQVTAKNVCGETQVANQTFKCKAYTDYQFTCADLEWSTPDGTAPIWITTTAGQVVRSQTKLHVRGTGLTPSQPLSFKIDDAAANDCSGTGSHDIFAIRLANYGAVTPDASGAIDADVYVFYNPTETADGLDLNEVGSSIVVTSPAGKVGTREYKSMSATLATVAINGRHLPSQFVIAARVGKTWYALPANITTNATQDPVIIGVNNSTNPTVAYCPTTYGFRLVSLASTEAKQSGGTADNGGFAANGEKVKLGLQNNLPMFGSTTTTLGNGGSATSLWGGGSTYWWTLEHKNAYATNINAVTYNIRTANTNANPLIRLSRGQWKWGLYNGGVEEIRLLSISPVEELTLEAMEWSTDELAVSYTGGGTLTKVQIGDAEEGSATMSSIGGDLQRISGLSSMVAGASGKQCQQMLIQITESGVLKQKILQVPFIVNSTDIKTTNLRDWTGGSTPNEKDSISWNMEIVVRPGAKLTTDANTGKFGALSVYPGGAVEISNVIRLARFTMRGGYSWLGSAFAMPHAKVTANVSGTGNKVVYDYYIDDTQYYDLALPKTMTWVPVTDDKGSEDFVYWVKQYDGATRAATGSGWAWYDWSGDPSSWSINAGQGYLLAATPKYGRPYLVMRFPMNMTLATDESTKAPISVTAHGMTAGALNPGVSVSANNAGWNLIANPFMTSYMKDADGYEGDVSLSGSIQVGELVPEIKDGKETGKYEWDATGGKNVRYVTTYSYATGEYKQHPMSSTVLEPFTGFFIQVAKDCSVKFDASGRQNNIIRRLRAGLPDDMEVGITVRFGDETDETILLLCDELSREDALEFPDENSKVMNAGHLNFYTFAGMTTMYANGMTYAEGQEWNAAGLTAIKDGEYTFSVSKVNTDYIKAVMLKDIYNNAEYDLLMSDVTLYLNKGTVDDRFALKIVLKSEQDTPTALDEIMEDGSSEGPKKYIYNNVMYIRHNNRIYDSTGRKILETNK